MHPSLPPRPTFTNPSSDNTPNTNNRPPSKPGPTSYATVSYNGQPYQLPFNPSLINPFAPQQFNALNPYLQQQQTNAQGYTLSSTYTSASSQHAGPSHVHNQPLILPGGGGTVPCKRDGCSFRGRTPKDTELHMMDRHFIYPPGWHERQKKRKRDDHGDGDGTPPVLESFGIKVQTPEEITKWVADRKKRYPSQARLEQKAREKEEAKARGELFIAPSKPSLSTALASSSMSRGRGRGRGRGTASTLSIRAESVDSRDNARGRGRGRGRGKGRGQDGGWRGRGGASMNSSAPVPLPASTGPAPDSDSGSDEDEASGSGSDMDPVKDAVSSKALISEVPEEAHSPAVDDLEEPTGPAGDVDMEEGGEKDAALQQDVNPPTLVASEPTNLATTSAITSVNAQTQHRPSTAPRRAPPQPRKAPHNPFATKNRARPTAAHPNRPASLLRSLIDNDVRLTISNLSQAIRFLVANDCLEGVELKPGEAEERERKRRRVEVIGEIEGESTMTEQSLEDVRPLGN